MKIYIVVEGTYEQGSDIMGVHQVEEYADRQADELMAVGDWTNAYSGPANVGPAKIWHWFRNADFVEIQEWELGY